MKGYKFKNWSNIVEENTRKIERLKEAFDYVIERLTDEAQERELIASQYKKQDSTEAAIASVIETEIANAYYDAANIVKDEVFNAWCE